MQVYPDKLQKEADELFDKWCQNNEGLSLFEYIDKYQSNELAQFRIRYRRKYEKSRKRGVTIN